MRRMSKKRRARLKEVAQFRQDFRAELGKCEWCQKKKPILHEIARGTADRKKALDARYAILGLCDPGCHQIVGEWPRAKQLALLLLRRPKDFDLPAFHAMCDRNWPQIEDVLSWAEQLQGELP